MSDRTILLAACVPMAVGILSLGLGQRTPASAAAAEKDSSSLGSAVEDPNASSGNRAWVGVVIAGYTAELAADAPGRVASITAQTGQHVEQGTPLLELDRAEAATIVSVGEAELGQRFSDVARAQARLEAAQSKVERLNQGEKWLSKQELETAKAEARMASAELLSARSGAAMGKAMLSQKQLKAARHTVSAPFAGTVVLTELAPGDAVTVGQVLARVYSADRKVRFALARSELPTSGAMNVSVRTAGAKDLIHATVNAFRPEIDPSTDLVFATAMPAANEMSTGAWLPGTPVEVTRTDQVVTEKQP